MMNYISGIISNFSIILLNAIDILLCSWAIYLLIKISKRSKTWQVLWGLVVFILLAFLTDVFKLHTANFLIKSFLPIAPVAVLLLFYPDLRKILEDMGSIAGPQKLGKHGSSNYVVNTIVKAVMQMSKTRTGALIVFERNNSLEEIINNGILMDSELNDDLLRTIFYSGTPLHDGALIIKRDRIVAAACTLPLTVNENFSKQIHTRHKAAIGITEITDALVIVVSEETGIISVSMNGKLNRHLNEDSLTSILEEEIGKERDMHEKNNTFKLPFINK